MSCNKCKICDTGDQSMKRSKMGKAEFWFQGKSYRGNLKAIEGAQKR